MPVHVHLLVESGIHIIECLNLDELAAAGVAEFLFVALPLKIRGATGRRCAPWQSLNRSKSPENCYAARRSRLTPAPSPQASPGAGR